MDVLGEGWVAFPEVGVHPQHRRQQVALVEVPGSERIVVEPIDRQRDEPVERDLLSDEHPQVLDRQLADRLLPELVHRPHEPAGTGGRVAPPVALQILERTTAIGRAQHAQIVAHGNAPPSSARVSVGHRYRASLFPGGVGTTNSPEDFRSLIDDVEERIFGALPDDTWFHPGGDDSTLREQRPHLAEWRERGW